MSTVNDGGQNAKVAQQKSLFSIECNYLVYRVKKHTEGTMERVFPVFYIRNTQHLDTPKFKCRFKLIRGRRVS